MVDKKEKTVNDEESFPQFQYLPPELQEFIFSKSEGKVVFKLHEISKDCVCYQKALLRNNDVWKAFCYREMSSFILHSLSSSLNFKSGRWLELYKSWYYGGNLSNRKLGVKNMITFGSYNPTVIKISGNCIVFGTKYGIVIMTTLHGHYVKHYTINRDNIVSVELYGLIKETDKSLNNIEPFKRHGHHFAVCAMEHGQVVLLNLSAQSKINGDCRFQILYQKHQGIGCMIQLSIYENYILASNGIAPVMLWSIEDMKDEEFPKVTALHTNLYREYTYPGTVLGRIYSCHISKPTSKELKIEIVSDDTKICYSVSISKKRIYETSNITLLKTQPNSQTVKKSWKFSNNMEIILYGNDKIRYQHCYEEKPNLMFYYFDCGTQILKGEIKAVASCSNLLAIGSGTGLMYLYILKPDTNYGNGKLLQKYVEVIDLQDGAISALDIHITPRGPIIVAGTASSIHYMSWFLK